jgi:hypothetical protein
MRFLSPFVLSFSSIVLHTTAWAGNVVEQAKNLAPATGTGADAMNSPFTVYTAGAVVDVMIVSVLVLTLFVGGFLVVNLGLMSHREQDQAPRYREPSEVGVLKDEVWPRQKVNHPVLPAELSEDVDVPHGPEPIPDPVLDEKTLLHEEDMPNAYRPFDDGKDKPRAA